ncbi:HNH endonuclease domain-containing protein [Alkalihalophilus pseudofirmus]|uniref:HNH endonuclease domain-containing protein n=1 Tax=Alkalihalophilus pseudofirmus TaxID=79885 RepID=A0AAJ2NKL2_ALKPS|nr:HNH endonuclease domain-containing protein [Alkalihalophilus pseudofirmus]MDV2884677.1 HNH endonuclease domain-containing protein [Alkalihalophilus pseudofirmus]
MSYLLKVGELQEAYCTDEEIWSIFTRVLSNKSNKTSTYKYVLIKAIIENLYNANERFEMSYDQLAYTFTKVYWNLIEHHNLIRHNHGQVTKIVTIIKEEKQRYGIPSEIIFDKLDDTIQVSILRKIKATMKRYVFGALYGDTQGMFYAFDHRTETLRLHPTVHTFMLKYQRLIIHLTNYHMAVMIESLNEVPSINYLLEKVEYIAQRSSLRPFEKLLLSHFNAQCFYCHKPLSGQKRTTHVDHFIPWSFVQSDQVWNLVLSCNTCNTRKSDKLPVRSFLDDIMERNETLQQSNDTHITRLMENYHDNKVSMLYEYSMKNGFDQIWTP